MEEVITDNYIESIKIFLTFSSQNKHNQIANGFKNRSILVAKLCRTALLTGYSCKEIDSTFNNPKGTVKGICTSCYDKIESLHPKLKPKKMNDNCLCGDYIQYNEQNFCFYHRMSPSENNDLNQAKKLFDCYFEALSTLISKENLNDQDIQEIKSQINLLFNLCQKSLMIRHFISGFLLKNYPILTRHFCFIEGGGGNTNSKDDYDSDNEINNNTENEYENDHDNDDNCNEEELSDNRISNCSNTYIHKCQCFFLQNLYRYMIDKKFPQSNLPLLFNEEKYTLCYLFLFDSSFFIKIIENESLLENLFEEISTYMKYCFNHENFSQAKCEKMITLFEHITNDFSFLTTKALEILSNNNTILITIITCLSYLQNIMPFSTFVCNERKEEKEVCQLLLIIEKILLELFSMLTNIFDYTDKAKTEEVIHELINRIKNKNFLTMNLKQNEYSFHIPINRALSIFLAKNIFTQELISQTNPKDILKELLMTQSINYAGSFNQMLNDILYDTLKCIGFINSISFMPNENDCLMYYSKQYYSLELFSLCDYSLSKLILSQNSDGSILELSSLLSQMNTCNIYDQILNMNKPETLSIDAQSFYAENLRTLSCILLNDTFFLNLIGYSCLVFPDYYCNEHIKDKLHKHFKYLMAEKITMVLLKKEKVSESEMSGKFPKGFSEKSIEKLLSKIAVENKMHKSKNIIEYKINVNYLEKIEFNTIISPQLYHQARTYLSLVSKSHTLFLCLDIKNPPCLKELNNCLKFYFFFKTHNIFYCIKILKTFLNNSDINNVSNEFIYQNLKMIYVYISHQNLLDNITLNNNVAINSTINNNNLAEINSLMRYPSKHNPTYEDFNIFYYKQIKRRNKNIMSTQFVQKQERRCCECNEILPDQGYNNYGQLGLVVSDSFIFHIHLQTIKAAYKLKKVVSEKITLKKLMLDYYSNYSQFKRSLRIISCKDFIHFHCFNKLLSNSTNSRNSSNSGENIIMLCPYCKMMFNCFIPLFSLENDDNSNFIEQLQRLTLSEIFSETLDDVFQVINNMNTSNSNTSTPNKNKISNLTDDNINGVLFFIQKIISIQNIKENNNRYLAIISKQGGNKEIEIIQKKDYVFIFNFYLNLSEMIYRYKYQKDLEILQKFILSLKCLIKNKIVIEDILMDKFKELIYWKSNHEESILLDNNKIETQYNEAFFLLLTLFDFSEHQYWKYILMQYLPYLYLQFYIWTHYINNFILKSEEIAELMNIRQFNSYLIEHSSELFSYLESYIDKSLLIMSVFDEREYIPMSFTEFINKNHLVSIKTWNAITLLSNIDYPKFWKISQISLSEVFEKYSKDKFEYLTQNNIKEDIINPALIIVNTRKKFEGIQLPIKRTEFLNRYNFQSTHMNVPHYYNIICLICGEKVCYTKDCCYSVGKKNTLDQYQYHNIICGKGNGIYLSVFNGTVIFSLMNIFWESKRRLYDFEKKNKKEMCLIKAEYEVIVEEFANMSLVKYFK